MLPLSQGSNRRPSLAGRHRQRRYYPRLEALEDRLAPATITIIDDGDVGFLSAPPAGAWTSVTGQGFQNDVTFAAAGTGTATATWNFSGLTPGTYRVAATWSAHPNRATNAPFTILNSTTALDTVLVNQEQAPNDFNDLGAVWELLGGPYEITGPTPTLVVRLTNQANEYVIADAIRIERVDFQIIDDGDAGFTATSGFLPFAGQGYQNDVRYAEAGTGSETATWTFAGLTPGTYRVSATWSAHPNRATNATYAVQDGTNVLAQVAVNQERAPDDLFEIRSGSGTLWEDLGGPHTIAGTTLVVRLSNQANEYVIADAVRIERLIVSTVNRIDDGDSGFSTVGEWTSVTGQGFGDDVTFSNPGTGSDTASWSFTSLVPGTYRIAATWTRDPNRATNAQYTILTTPARTFTVNQQLDPADFTDAGFAWQYLGGALHVTGGSLTVRLNDLADGFVIADTVRLERVADEGTWLRLAPMPSSRQEISTAVLNGEIYVIAGYNAGFVSTNTVEVYNPVTNTWRTAAPLPIGNDHNASAVVGGFLYSFGGLSNRVFRYDPGPNSWTEVAPMNYQHGGTPAVGVINGKIYVAGGHGPGMTTQRELEVYDPVTNMWTVLASMSVARNHTGGGVIDGLFYVAGGRDTPGAPTALEVYNPATNTWATRASLPTGRSGIGTGVVDGLLYVFGGEEPQLFSNVEVYNPADNSWRALSPMPTPRHGLFGAVLGNRIYFPGGGIVQGLGPANTNEVFVVS